jgi:hypothetical protein
MILAAFGAIAFSWNFSNTRNLFILSLLVVTLEFLAPVFFFPFIQVIEDFNLGPWLRILPGGLASILAFFGLYQYYCQKFNVRPLANT